VFGSLRARHSRLREAARGEELLAAESALEAIGEQLCALRERSGLPDADALEESVRRRDAEERRAAAAGAELARLFPWAEPSTWPAAVEAVAADDPGRAPARGRLADLESHERLAREHVAELVVSTEGTLREGLLRTGEIDLPGARAALERIDEEERLRARDREAARLALDALDQAEADVDGRLDLALRDADGGASALFRALTCGRWTAIRRGSEGLEALRGDGTLLPVRALSRGTLDQLHVALRAALAERVLGGPAFFLWDDTSLTADPERRRALVGACSTLVGRGWQVLYLTVDPSIAELFESEARRWPGLALVRARLEAGTVVVRDGIAGGPGR
jgi:hypothetical protein